MVEAEGGLIDIDALSKELMKSVLGPYVQFDPTRQEFVFTEEWNKLNNNLKLLTYLIGRKGVSASGHLSDEEAASSKTIIEQTHLPGGSVNYSVKMLFDDKIIAKTGSGKCYVPSAKLHIVAGMIRDAQTEGPKPVTKRKTRKRKGTGQRRKAGE